MCLIVFISVELSFWTLEQIGAKRGKSEENSQQKEEQVKKPSPRTSRSQCGCNLVNCVVNQWAARLIASMHWSS